jgi:hypothetical protein
MTTWSDIAAESALATSMTDSATSVTLTLATGYPTANFYIVIDPGLSTEEVIFVGARSGVALSGMIRAAGIGSTAFAHAASATVVHAITGSDLLTLSGLADVAMTAHLAASDPHPQYQTQTEGDARYYQLSLDLATQVELDAETAARIAGDSTNATAISSEANTRAAADTTLSTNISNEAIARAAADSLLTPLSRTLTINGTALDLSANRSWTVGDVLTGGSYANPSWITSLAWSKITGTPTTLSGYGILTDADSRYAQLAAANTFTLGPNLFKAGADGNVALAARRHSSGSTANIQEWQNQAGGAVAYVSSSGGLFATSTSIFGNDPNPNSGLPAYIPGAVYSDVFKVGHTFTDLTGIDFPEGIFSSVSIDHSANAPSVYAYSGDFGIVIPSGNTKSLGGMAGINGIAQHKGTGAVSGIYGLNYSGILTGAAVVGGVYGAYLASYNEGGTLTDLYGTYVDAETYGGATTNQYGVYVYTSASGVTNNYGLYIGNVSGGSSINRAIHTAGGEVRHLTGAAAVVGMSIQAAASQSADLLRLLASDGTTKLSYFDSAGDIFLPTKTANTIFAGPTSGGAARPTWRTLVAADIPSLSSVYQPLDSDLTTIAGLTATTNNFIVSVASAWASRTPAQVKTTLSLDAVENTALSTWAGSTNITTLGTIATGTWSGTLIAASKGGTGVANGASATLTLPNAATTITTGGTLALGGFTLTVPATGTTALLGTANAFTALNTITRTDSGTNTVLNVLTLAHDSSGSIAANFGTGLTFQGQSTTTADRDMASINAIWTTATDASRAAGLIINVASNTALAEAIRFGTVSGIRGISAIGGNTSANFTATNLNGVNASASFTIRNQASGSGTSVCISTSLSLATGQYFAIIQGLSVETARFVSEAATASTAAVVDNLILRRNPTSGTPAAGTGHQLHFVGKSDTTADRDMYTESAEWIVATDASRKARAKLSVFDTAVREVIRMDADGARANIGFLGASDFASGSGVIAILNATTAPSGTPSGGGVLYVESGALKFKGSSGTITVLGVA